MSSRTSFDPAGVGAPLAPELACPRCRAGLEARAGELVCSSHGSVGRRTSDEVFEFDRSDAYWGEVSREEMRRINVVARRDGWGMALETELGPAHPELVPYVQHPARGDWQVLVPLDREHTVAVDVGAGWGANSFAVRPNVQRLYAVEKIGERIEFLATRARQEAARGLIPVRADLHALPFAPSSVDLCIVNGVLEWAGLVDAEAGPGRPPAPPRQLQERFLRQLATLLRPGGFLYVGIENRYGRMFWHGTPDHQGLRYTSLMPRPMARAYTYLRAVTSPRTYRAERDYRAWTYSLSDYRQLLVSCGFELVHVYAVIPGYNVPTQLVSLADSGPSLYLASRHRHPHRVRGMARRTLRRLMAGSGLEAQVSSCYAFIARRPGSPSHQ